MNHEQTFARVETSGEDGAFVRIDETHPVDMFLGLEGGRRTLMIVCTRRPPEPPLLAALRIELRKRTSGAWSLVVRLERPEFKSLFNRLVEDLYTATLTQTEESGEVVISRLSRWQRLFSRGPSTVLEDHELRGLAAELSFLLDEAIPTVGARAAVEAWVGPYDAPKDFVFPNVEVEVKATYRQSRTVVISSLEQLTDAGLPIFLWTRTVELGTALEAGAASFTSLVQRVRTATARHPDAQDLLEDALRAAGYEDRPEYQSRSVRFGTSACFAIRPGFPRLQRSEVPATIASCRYELTLDRLGAFASATWREDLLNGH